LELVVIIIAVVVLLGAGGAGAYVYRAVARPLPALGLSGDRAVGSDPELGSNGSAVAQAAVVELGSERRELDRLWNEARAVAAEVDNGLARLRERRDAVLAEAEALASRVRDELAKAETARRLGETTLAELERGRERLAALSSRADDGAAVVQAGAQAERAETIAELYRRLARVETTLAALTAPILLPGERFVVPEEFPPEALRWENWKEVGESAYALGDYFHGRRLLLEGETAEAMGGCLSTLRVALTEQVYPNLHALPSPEDADALRAGLARIAAELAAVRARLEADYRRLAGVEPPKGRHGPAA
jgi:hypothetical protein